MKNIFPNTREGRDNVLNEIEKLQEKGYARQDLANKAVIMSKLQKGKVCSSKNSTIFLFARGERAIHKEEKVSYNGVENAKAMLFGWNSLQVEAKNAVKAGLIDETDFDILRATHTEAEWQTAISKR